MNAINQIALVPFLMSFLASREELPMSTVTSAGKLCLAHQRRGIYGTRF